MRRSLVYSLIAAFFFFLITPHRVFATGEFQADYDVAYDVAPSGTTIVTENITLTNKIPDFYPDKYSFVIDSGNIKNVIAFDAGGMINPAISTVNNQLHIVLPFNEKALGIGKQTKFSFRYEDGSLARKNGSIWEINIPGGITKDPDIVSYSVSLQVPPSFGPNAYLTPPPANGGRWTKEQMMNGGISAAYGTKQAFSLNLSYYVENPNVIPGTAEIALPPDTPFQKVIIRSLEPKPKTVVRDDDGNWLARYELLPAERREIQAKIIVLLTLTPSPDVTEPISDLKPYLAPLKYWDVSNPQIRALAKTYTTPRDIYNYVVKTLSYDESRVSLSPARKGAVAALAKPNNSICMEFTDVFVAIARAAGIPAREVVGYAHTNDTKLRPMSLVSDVLHSWPEYYDSGKNMWIPIDPTWANTTGGVNYFDKLDFNHIAFVIHGISSEYPYPVGLYKKSGNNTKDVDVTFTSVPQTIEQGKMNTSYTFPQRVTSGFPASGTVTITNPTGIEIPESSVVIHSTPFDVALSKTFDHIPPFATISVPLTVQLPGYFLSGTGNVSTIVDGQETRFSYTIQPFMSSLIVPLIITVVSIVLLIFVIIKSRGLWKR